MKRFLCAAALICTAAVLLSCGDKGKPKDTSGDGTVDWHNKIEYEGSFYVNKDTKLLYALDRGTVTLWDDAGSGSVLQVLKYETAADDAMERMETPDADCDANRDIRIVYKDAPEGSYYNLWLWNTQKGKFDACSLYKSLCNPVHNDDGTVTAAFDKGVFGTVVKVYGFDETRSLSEISSVLTDEEAVATRLAGLLGLGAAKPADSSVTVENAACSAYITYDGEGETGYLSCSPDGDWYADMYHIGGLYRILEADGDDISLGAYTDDAKKVYELVTVIVGSDLADPVLAEKTKGRFDGKEAIRYGIADASATDTFFGYIISAKSGWYFSTDGTSCKEINSVTGQVGDSVAAAFEVN